MLNLSSTLSTGTLENWRGIKAVNEASRSFRFLGFEL